jgi:catechol 2,3-dioxygenase-like lactoylglutathione lyase family enzyme
MLTQMPNQKVVPLFPTANLKATLGFYTMLGFTVLYEQHAPYVYGSVALEEIQMDFIGSKSLIQHQETGHTCLVVLSNIHTPHAAFSSQIKTAFGKQLRSGIPRMSSLNAAHSTDQRFHLLDPSGNRIVFIEVGKKSPQAVKGGSPLTRAVHSAKIFAFSKDDPALAAKNLDKALSQSAAESTITQFQALVLRAEIAQMQDDTPTFEKSLKAARGVALEPADLKMVQEEMQRLRELES